MAASLGARALAPDPGMLDPRVGRGLVREGDAASPRCRFAEALLRRGEVRRRAPGPREGDRAAPHPARGAAHGHRDVRVAARRWRGAARPPRGAAAPGPGCGATAAPPGEPAP